MGLNRNRIEPIASEMLAPKDSARKQENLNVTDSIQAHSRECSTPSPVLAELLTERELAAMARLSPSMLQKLRREGGGAAFVRIGSAVRYPLASVHAWLRALTN